jgi:hypothetical protein
MQRAHLAASHCLPLDIDFESDIKIQKLYQKFGTVGMYLYIHLLTKLYQSGYIIHSVDTLQLGLCESVGSKWNNAKNINNIVDYMVKLNIFDKELFAVGILTSKAIQKNFIEYGCGNINDLKEFNLLEKNVDNNSSFGTSKLGLGSEKTKKPATKESNKENNIYNNNNINISSKVLKDSINTKDILVDLKEIKNKENNSIIRFKKPSVEEIGLYLKERKNTTINPEAFYDYYESKGWLIGKSPMKDWKAAVRTWEHNDYLRRPSNKPKVNFELNNKKDDSKGEF